MSLRAISSPSNCDFFSDASAGAGNVRRRPSRALLGYSRKAGEKLAACMSSVSAKELALKL